MNFPQKLPRFAALSEGCQHEDSSLCLLSSSLLCSSHPSITHHIDAAGVFALRIHKHGVGYDAMSGRVPVQQVCITLGSCGSCLTASQHRGLRVTSHEGMGEGMKEETLPKSNEAAGRERDRIVGKCGRLEDDRA